MFKGLEDRFLAKQKELYYKYSARDGSTTDEPYLEKRPTELVRDLRHTSRMNYGQAASNDFIRLSKFTKSERGLSWMLLQQNLQSGNTFTQTRVINPAFVLGNTLPNIHLRRPLSTPGSDDVSGDKSQMSPQASSRIGTSGRLQKETSLKIVSHVATGKGGALNTILKLLPPNTILTTLAGATQLIGVGSLGVNQRPELDINNNNQFNSYYSVALWQGFVRNNSGSRSKLEQAASRLRSGNIIGAAESLANTAKDVVSGVKSLFGGKRDRIPLLGANNNNALARSQEDTSINGRRYFIKNDTQADRYLANSVDFIDNIPHASTIYLEKAPYSLSGETISVIQPTQALTNAGISTTTSQAASNTKRSLGNQLKNLNRVILRGAQFLNTGITPLQVLQVNYEKQISDLAKKSNTTKDENNPAESNMTFPQLSMKSRYEESNRLETMKAQLNSDIQKWKTSLPKTPIGYMGGWSAGDDIKIDPLAKTNFVGGRYLSDAMNSILPAIIIEDSDNVSQTTINQNRQVAEPLIDMYFFDVINRRAIPFRAYITALSENITPEFNDSTRYIGRIEKNVVYSGVSRECTFTLMLHAFNEQELGTIWQKINYLTGLCYPAQYVSGFMVPPLVKLTLGDVYNNQPGYISSLTITTEDDTPWEITPTLQVPHGITASITFRILEKQQMQSDSTFYSFGLPRSTGAERRRTSDLSETQLEQANESARAAQMTNVVNNSTVSPINQGHAQQSVNSLISNNPFGF